MKERTYIAIDLKSFYASVECVDRGLDPLNTNLVVADSTRTEKTICLAVTPSLKAHKISGRARLFEVVQRVKEVNRERRFSAPKGKFTAKSYIDSELKENPSLELDFLIAPPQMARYMEISRNIYKVYKKYVSEDDIVVYSIDEVFIDATDYIKLYKTTAHDLAMKIILDVLSSTGITATAGIGTNLFLAKVAMDVYAKRIPADKNGVRIASLNEKTFREQMWDHKPITDFWRIGQGTAKRLAEYGMYTLGDIALCSLGKKSDFYNEDLLFKIFGINAELLIDHAWGYEPCTIPDIKGYVPTVNSLSSGQVLHEPYDYEKTKLIVKEMADLHSLDLVKKRLLTDQIVLTIGYDVDNLKNGRFYDGEITTDRYGRSTPKHAHGTINLEDFTSSTEEIVSKTIELFDRIIDKNLLVRRINLVFAKVITEKQYKKEQKTKQLSIFDELGEYKAQSELDKKLRDKEKSRQKAIIEIQEKYGKNALLKGMNYEKGATTKDRNSEIGGHKA